MTDNSLISIDFDALDHNIKVVRDAVGPGVAINVVVKADAYGLGASRVARRLVQAGASMLTVYSPSQAEALEGVTVPVLVLQPVSRLERGGALHSMLVAGRLHLVVHDIHHVAELIVLADEHGVRLPVHLRSTPASRAADARPRRRRGSCRRSPPGPSSRSPES